MTKPKPKEEPDDVRRFLSGDPSLARFGPAYARLSLFSKQIARAGLLRHIRACRAMTVDIDVSAVCEILNDAKHNRKIYAEETP
jgi:hypothetical protein